MCVDLKNVSTGSHDTTIELSQSMDATMSQDMIADIVPPSLPVEDNEFNLHLSNTTTVTQCSAVSQELEEVSCKMCFLYVRMYSTALKATSPALASYDQSMSPCDDMLNQLTSLQ